MCLIVFAYKTVPGIPLVLAGNRDEFYERPTEKAHIWESVPRIIAGKDKKAGGTWLGLSEEGRVAAITNYRDMSSVKPDAPSRGEIVRNALTSALPTESYLNSLKNKAEEYNGFNLITGNREKLFYFSNKTMKIEELKPGIYGISNALLNTPWPKTEWAKKRFKMMINSELDDDICAYFSLLSNSDTYPSVKLPETGLGEKMEKAVSAVFIKTEEYGTRSSTVLQLFDDRFYFEERAYKAGSKNVDTQQIFTRF